jgi:small-conductance mechanosensitive channel
METIKDRLINLLGFEPVIALALLALTAYMIYRFALKKLNPSRHVTMKRLFRELMSASTIFILLWLIQFGILQRFEVLDRFYNYVGVAAVVFGAIVFVRIVKIMVFEYLFFKSMTAGVPVLLVNLVTLVFSIFIGAWLSTSVFGVRWAPLLATSALVSVVLGLALQDTLGNLFAGVALQFDKPYEIGDWIEVHGTNGEIFTGEVNEITWRATILFGFFDEVLTLPNRLVAQSDVSNFSARKKPIYRGLNVTLDAEANEEKVKAILFQVLKETDGVLQDLQHLVMLRDLTEKGAVYRLFYPIAHFSRQFIVVDEILMRTQAELKKAGIGTSRLRVEVAKNG